jgi:ribosomal-protein-alanine N-acetyltransferase
VPTLRTERLELRPFTEDDGDLVHRELLADPMVMAGFPISPPPTLAEALIALRRRAEHWRANGFGMWAVQTTAGSFVGECGLRRLEETGEAEIAYAIVRSHWKQGYASEAAARTISFAFDECGLDRVIAVTIRENHGSQAVLRRCGFSSIGSIEVHGHVLPAFALERNARGPRS